MYVFNRGEYLLVNTDQSQVTKLLEIFDHYIIMDDVEATNSSEKLTAIGMIGPEAPQDSYSRSFFNSRSRAIAIGGPRLERTGMTLSSPTTRTARVTSFGSLRNT